MTRRDDRDPAVGGGGLRLCLSVGSACLGVGAQYGTVRRSGHPDHPLGATATNGRAHGCTTVFRYAPGGPRPAHRLASAIGTLPSRRPSPGSRRDPCRSPLDLRHSRPFGRSPPHRRGGRLYRRHTRPDRRDPARPRRPRRPRRRPDRDRQDRRVRPADPRSARGPTPNTSFSPARHPVRVLILVPTRELAMQVDASVATYGRTVPLRSTVVYGGIPMDPQIKALRAGVEILVATPGRLLDLVGQTRGQPRPGRDPRARRGRPDARHGLPAGHPADHRAAPGEAAEPDVLGDVLRRHPAALRHDPARPGDRRGRGAEPGGGGRQAAGLPGRPRPQGGPARPPHPDLRPAPGPGLHADQARREPAGDQAGPRRASMRSRSTRTARSRSARRRSRASRTARSACWWPPTSRPAASISRTSRSS